MDLMEAWLENHGDEVRIQKQALLELTDVINAPPFTPVKVKESKYYLQCLEERAKKREEEELLKSLWEPVHIKRQHTTKKILTDSFIINF
jgi:hypothetical protein